MDQSVQSEATSRHLNRPQGQLWLIFPNFGCSEADILHAADVCSGEV